MDFIEWGNKWLKEKRDKQYRHNYCKSTKAFLNYIGECPVKCYKYKWDYERK